MTDRMQECHSRGSAQDDEPNNGSAQDDEPNNYDECGNSNGICIDGGCPDNSQEIGMCDDYLFCCRRREE
ncbi:Hypothetical predicted protein [Podarcis lilfordi]|uniref:Uncharacterized protein n=1 Tax=Podarcis lilfordi TaxID=74358 RepID=A0AA35P1E7_9SAUR|nr:Hypothetical predicted protein [Podarcis lilfordi]